MFYQDYQAIAQIKQQEVERKAKNAWKFFEQPKIHRSFWPARTQKSQPECCPAS